VVSGCRMKHYWSVHVECGIWGSMAVWNRGFIIIIIIIIIIINIRGRQRKKWFVDIEEDMQIIRIKLWRKKCKERTEWKRITEKPKTHRGL